jgi:hypothetical protein
VICLDEVEWDQSVNYLFFRNNYPHTVSQKAENRPGSSAYCCQCSWISVNTIQRLSQFPNLHWICGGHDS